MKAHLVEIAGQRCGCVRVVGDIKHDSGLPSQYLKASCQLNRHETGAHRLLRHRQQLPQGFQGGQRRRGVQELVGAAQRRILKGIAPHTPGGKIPLLLVA